jgi:hypothetical protein
MCLKMSVRPVPTIPQNSGDSPCSLIESSRRPRPGNGDGAGNQIRRARKHKRNCVVKPKRLDSRGEEVLETVGTQVAMLHENEEPDFGIFGRGEDTAPARRLARVAYSVSLDAFMGKGALFRGEPAGGQRLVGENESGDDGDDEGDGALDNKEPLPARDSSLRITSLGCANASSWILEATYHAVHLKDTKRNQTCKRRRQDIAGVQDGDSRRQLFPRVKRGQDVQCSRIVWRLRDAQEETRQKQADEVGADSGKTTDNGPDSHARSHPPAGADTGDDHVGRDTDENVADKEDGDTGLVLGVGKLQIRLQGVEFGECNGISVL